MTDPTAVTEQELLEEIAQRDQNAEWANRLADAIGAHFGVDVGEHSNGCNPWLNALNLIRYGTVPDLP